MMNGSALNLVAAAVRYGLDQTATPCWIEHEGRIRYANRALAELLALREPAELVGKRAADLIDRPAGGMESRAAALVAGLMPASGEQAVLRGAGEPLHVEVSRTLVSYESEVMVLCSFRDTRKEHKIAAELRELESRFRRLVDSNLMGVIEFDAERILAANDYFLAMAGRSRAELERGELRWRELSAPGSGSKDEESLSQMLRAGDCVGIEMELCRPDGVRVPVLLRCAQVVRSQDYRAICFVVDLSDRKKQENVESERLRLDTVGVLASGLAHSLNNLLTTIMGNASLLLEYESVGASLRTRDLVSEIIATGEQAASLATRLLAYSGQGKFAVARTDLSELIRAQVERMEPSLPPTCRLRSRLPENLPQVFGDPKQLASVVEALISNAVEAVATRNDGDILVEAWLEDVKAGTLVSRSGEPLPGGQYCVVSVRDNGVGMDENTLARAFDPFFSTKFQGRGLGLASVAGIVGAAQGAIQVHTAPGKGCRVRVYLPPG